MAAVRSTSTAVIALCTIAGCTAGGAVGHALPHVALPPPPAAPRLTLAAILPDPAAPPPSAPWWRTLIAFITGAPEGGAEAPGALARPFGVAVGPGGEIFVADPDEGRVVRFDARASPTPIACADQDWGAPMALALDPGGALYVADAGDGTVVRWTAAGCSRMGGGVLDRPTGVAFSGERIWVADPPSQRVVAFDGTGAVVAKVGDLGTPLGVFHFPSALTSLPGGGVAVVDSLNFRIVTLDGQGKATGAFGGSDAKAGGLERPKAVALDEGGRFWVTDAQRDALVVFERDGAFAFEVGTTGDAPGQLAHPAGIAAATGRLVVADSHNHRVQVFAFTGAAP